MKSTLLPRCPGRVSRLRGRYHPEFLSLEDRLPLGDTILGPVLGAYLLEPGLAVADVHAIELDVRGAEKSPVIRGRTNSHPLVTSEADSAETRLTVAAAPSSPSEELSEVRLPGRDDTFWNAGGNAPRGRLGSASEGYSSASRIALNGPTAVAETEGTVDVGVLANAGDASAFAARREAAIPRLGQQAAMPPNFVITDTTRIPLVPDTLGTVRCDGTPPDKFHGICFADGLNPSFYRSDGNLALFTSNGSSGIWLRTAADFRTLVDEKTPFQHVTVDLSTRPPDQYPIHQIYYVDPAVWIEGVLADGQGTLYAIYHDENDQPCFASYHNLRGRYRVGMAKSVDEGLHWTDLGIVLKGVDSVGPRCDSQSTDTVGGEGDVTLYVDTRNTPTYVYIFFSSYDGTIDQGYQGVGVARMPLADIEHPVGRFQKWYQGKWGDAGAGPGAPLTPIFPATLEMHPTVLRPPLPAPCVATSDFVWGPHVYFDANVSQYVMLLNRISDPSGVCAAYQDGGSWHYGNWNNVDIRVSFTADLSDPASWTHCTPETPQSADACDADSRVNSRPFYVGGADDLGIQFFYAQAIGLERGDTSQDIADSDPKNQPRLFADYYQENSDHLFHVLRDDEGEPGGQGVIVRHTHEHS